MYGSRLTSIPRNSNHFLLVQRRNTLRILVTLTPLKSRRKNTTELLEVCIRTER
jgi:hypothetical protein